jgi:7-cyano-7-deazaguanine synthase
MDHKNKVIVLSGGLDSSILTYDIVNKFGAEKIFALTFDYTQKHKIELEKAKLTCSKLNINHRIINIDFLGDISKDSCALIGNSKLDIPSIKDVLGDPQPISYVGYRNLILNSIALSYAESINADEVYNGLSGCDLYGYWDSTVEFVEALNKISLLNRKHQIKITAPYVNLFKYDELKIGHFLDVPFEDTHSCYNPNDKGESCGVCPTCSERIAAFVKFGIPDPVPYSREIDWNTLISSHHA